MGCVFCASGLDGLERNLTTGEIVEQMLRLQRLLAPDERLSHIVVMGMGEPLANLDNLLPALDEASREDGLGISARRITISTVGLPKPMRRLAEAGARYRLAVSLHAPNDEIRRQIVPVGEKISLADILAEADHYFDLSGRQLTFEYVLLAGINDSPEHAHELARLLGRRTALVNVIPFNPVSGLPYRTPSTSAQQTFRRILEDHGLAVRFRHKKGDAIDAACGQLRRRTVHQIRCVVVTANCSSRLLTIRSRFSVRSVNGLDQSQEFLRPKRRIQNVGRGGSSQTSKCRSHCPRNRRPVRRYFPACGRGDLHE